MNYHLRIVVISMQDLMKAVEVPWSIIWLLGRKYHCVWTWLQVHTRMLQLQYRSN